MLEQVRVEIAGIGLVFRYRNCHLKEEGVELYARDFICPGKNDIIIDVKVDKIPDYPKQRALFRARENWRLYEDNGRYIFETFQSYKRRYAGITGVCFIEKKLSGGKVYISPESDNMVDVKSWSLEQLMKILGHLIIISILHRFQGMLIHSSGIILNKEGIIFSGISGAGKTTLSKLWQKRDAVTVLSDDRVIVRRERKEYFVYGTPWPGEGKAASFKKAPLKRIIFLSKARKNLLIPIERKEALRQLITQCFPAIWNKQAIDFAIKFCGMLVRDIPCFSFGFVPDDSAVEYFLRSHKELNKSAVIRALR